MNILLSLWLFQVGYEPSQYNIDDLLNAIAVVESNCKADAVGDLGKAVGMYQIHKIYVDDVNRILGHIEYRYSDRLNAYRSHKMVKTYLMHYGKGKSIYDMARLHNGGPRGNKKASTLPYLEKIIRALEGLK